MQAFTWEIRLMLIMNDEKNKSAAIFIHPPMVEALGKQKGRENNHDGGDIDNENTTSTSCERTATRMYSSTK